MAWNEPGSPKNNDPWGGRKNQKGPPDLDDVIRNLQKKLGGLFGGKGGGSGSSGSGGPLPGPAGTTGIIGILVIAALVWLAYDSVYIMQPAERGVVLRFGKYVDTIQPGPSIRMPRPIERVVRVDVDQIRNVELGYRSEGRKPVSVLSESLMLTQDENIVDIKLAVQYKVKSPDAYLFNDRDPDITLSSAAESAIREVIGKSTMDFVVGEGRADVASRSQQLIQTIVDRYETGLQVTSVNLQDAQPPEPVQEAFNDAIRAREDKERLQQQAEAYANEVIPKARGEAARFMEDANAYKAQVVAEAEGNTSRFSQVLTEYEKAPEVTRERMYIDSLESVLGNASKIMIDVEKGNNLMYLPLDRLGGQRSSETTTSGMLPPPVMVTEPTDTRARTPLRTPRPTREVR